MMMSHSGLEQVIVPTSPWNVFETTWIEKSSQPDG